MTPGPRRTIVLGIPAYFSPVHHRTEWTRIASAPAGSVIVVNPDSGPSDSMRGDYGAVVAAARRRGCLVYGYVDSGYGERAMRAMARDARVYRSDLGVDGVFLDRAGGDPDALRALDGVAASARRFGLRVAVNPGHPHVSADVLDGFDEVVLFEGPLDAYAGLPATSPPPWDGVHARPWHLVYGVRSPSVMAAVVSVAAWRGAELVFVTDRPLPNPWDVLPEYWDREIDAVRRASVPSILP